MGLGENFKASVLMSISTGAAFVFDFGFTDNASGTTHVDTGTAAGDFQTLVQAKLQAVLPDGVRFDRYRFACVAGSHAGEIGYVDVSPPVYGLADSTNALPCEIAISLKRSTGYASRHDRGRVFLGPVPAALRDTSNTDKVLLSDSSLQQARDLLKADLVTQTRTLKPVILAKDGSYFMGRVVTKVSIGEIFVHQRSRRIRQGI